MPYPHRDNITASNKTGIGENEKSLAVSFPQCGFLSMDQTTLNNLSNRKKPLERTIGQTRRAYCHAPSYSHSGQNPPDVFNRSLNIEQDQMELPITSNPGSHSLKMAVVDATSGLKIKQELTEPARPRSCIRSSFIFNV